MSAALAANEAISSLEANQQLPVLLVISGPSGVGKDTLVRALIDQHPEFYFVVTATSRPPRPGEIDGVDYFFVTEEAFEEMIADGELLEYALVHDNYKGVPKSQIRKALDSGRDVIMRVDPQGAKTLRRFIPDAIYIFISAESIEAIMRRLESRSTETAEAFELRMEITRKELNRIDEFDYLVLNREGAKQAALDDILSIIRSEKCRVHRKPISI